MAMVGSLIFGGALMDWIYGRRADGVSGSLVFRAMVGAAVAGGGLVLIVLRPF